jgi:hypothetical protein
MRHAVVTDPQLQCLRFLKISFTLPVHLIAAFQYCQNAASESTRDNILNNVLTDDNNNMTQYVL